MHNQRPGPPYYPSPPGGVPYPTPTPPYPTGSTNALGFNSNAPMPPYIPSNVGGYPQTSGGYPPSSGGYSPTSNLHPPTSCNYPPSSGGYPPPVGNYTPSSGGYPPSTCYPPSGGSYPTSISSYPPSSESYGPSSNPYQSTNNPYPPAQNTGSYSSNNPPTGNPYPSLGAPNPTFHHSPAGVSAEIYGHGYQRPQAPNDGKGFIAIPKGRPTLFPAHPFDPTNDAEVLRKAMKGFGTDEKAIIHVLTNRTNAQRLKIAVEFKTLYGKDLIRNLKSECSGKFESLIVAMMTPINLFYARELHDAIHGLGTDESVLIEIMCTKSNQEIMAIRKEYDLMFKSLEDDLMDDTRGTFKRLMVSLCNAGRNESMNLNPEAARADAETLFRAGELTWGTDESSFNTVICQRSYAQLRLVFEEYQKLTGNDIESTIKKEFSGDAKQALLAVIRSIKNQSAFFAKLINKSMKGMGTNDRDLIRLIVTRSEIDMFDIKEEYHAKYQESLADAIKADCSGDYKNCLLHLIGEK